MTNEEAIKRLLYAWFVSPRGQLCVDMDKKDGFCEAIGVAVNALRAQQTKLDRSRWEKCGKCSFSERYHQYCPECGRPQTEEAWAELERRINGVPAT